MKEERTGKASSNKNQSDREGLRQDLIPFSGRPPRLGFSIFSTTFFITVNSSLF
jgi:hypothetical protein